MDILRITGLHKQFGDKIVLDGLDLTVPRNSIFGFIGKNGSGKTTTMKTILGLLRADAGQIFVDGEKVSYGQTSTNRHIGYLPDVPEFYSFMTAPEYLRFCGQITGLTGSELSSRIQELLEKTAEKSFEIKVEVQKEFDEWYERTYGKQEDFSTEEEDAEFASILGQYFPEADVE